MAIGDGRQTRLGKIKSRKSAGHAEEKSIDESVSENDEIVLSEDDAAENDESDEDDFNDGELDEFDETSSDDDDDVDTNNYGLIERSLNEEIEAARRESERERLAAANALHSWISEERPTNAAILQKLEEDIRASRKLNEWGGFSLDDLLRPPAYDHSRHWAARLANVLTIVRNIALFLPVLVTWYAIERAAGAYAGQRTETFLQVWGKEWWSLRRVALIDAVIIGSLILLTLAAHVFEARAESVARSREDHADARFREVMVHVGLYLHGFRQITPAALGGGLADSVNQLVIAAQAMRDAADDMKLITAEGSKTLEEFAALSAREFAPASERLASLASTLEAAAQTHGNLSELVKTLQGQLSGTIGAMEGNLRTLINELVEQLKDNVNAVAVSSVDVGMRIDQIGTNLQGAAASVTAALESLYRRRFEGSTDGISRT